MVDYRLQSKTNAPFLTPKLRVMQRNIMVLHSFVVSSPEPIYAILPTSVYYTPHSFIPYALLLYTTRPTPLYHAPHPFILYAPPIYTIYPTTYIPYTPPLYAKKIINKAAKAR